MSAKASAEFGATEDVVELINDIIEKNNLDPNSIVEYGAGSEAGDGYMSKTLTVNIRNKNTSLSLFLKCPLNMKSNDAMPYEILFPTEIYFYNTIYPVYMEFLKERGVDDGFRNVPKCYGTSEKNIIALENLKAKGFTLCNRKSVINENHIILVLTAFAKFHALSFAFKDQEREKYEELVSNTVDFFAGRRETPEDLDRIQKMIEDVLDKMDTIKDKHILDRREDIVTALCSKNISAAKAHLNEYSTITQGDCWCNNMMFTYEDDKKENPLDVMLLDWQLVRPASVVFDLSYYFYTTACEEALSKLNYYLKAYYEELSKQLRKLGSDPNILYPYSVMEREWKQFSKHGFLMAFFLIRFMLSTKDETVNFEEVDLSNQNDLTDIMSKSIKNEDEYQKRLRDLADHFVKNDFL